MIKNLIPGLPELGKIKAGKKGDEVISSGGKKFRVPVKLDHYIITTTERDDNGDYVIDLELMERLKNSEDAVKNKNGDIVGIPIQLLYNDISLNFQTQYACYVSGKCTCSGDGEKARTRDGRNISCPCERLTPGYEGNKCKANGKLYAIIKGTKSVGACHVLRTTSINSVKSIMGGLAFIQAASNGLLAFLPLVLMLSPKSVLTPQGAPTTVYVSSIVFSGDIDQLRNQVLGLAKDKAQYLLEMSAVEANAREMISSATESDEEQADVQAEFYPEGAKDVIPATDDPPPHESKKDEEPETDTVVVRPETISDKKEEIKDKQKEESKPQRPRDKVPPPETPISITTEQKHEILALKRKNKITNPDVWSKLLKKWNVKTAVFLSSNQADEFIEELKANPT